MIENIKNHPVFSGYAVTTCGRFYKHSKVTKVEPCDRFPNGRDLLIKGRWLKLSNHAQGYDTVTIRISNTQSKTFLAHRLVAETHIPNPNNLPCVNHKDGNKKNNHVDNLEWVSNRDNTIHAINTGLVMKKPPTMFGENHPRSAITQEVADMIRKYNAPYKEICKVFGVNKSMVSRIKNNKSYTKSEVNHAEY